MPSLTIARLAVVAGVLAFGLSAGGCGADTNDDPPGGCIETIDACAGEQVCVAGRCEAAFPRVYTLRITNVTFPAMKPPDNECWDLPCSAPDPFFSVNLNDQEVGRTNAVQDQNAVSFTGAFDLSLIAGSKLLVGLFDEDIAEHDLIGACRVDPVSPDPLRGRLLSCMALNGAFSMQFRLDPKQ